MTWSRIDDTLAFHPKAEAAGNAAMGLWVRAMAYSAQQLTDGFVPESMVGPLGGKRRDADRLVAVGLWLAATWPPVGGDLAVRRGWTFHDWSHYQPTKEKVHRDRAMARDRQQKARDAASSRRDKNVTGGVTGGVTSHELRSTSRSPHPDPTQPTPPTEEKNTPPAAPSPRRAPRSLTEPDSFVEFWDAYGKIGSRKTAVTAYGKALAKTDAATMLSSVLAHWSGPWAKKDRDYIPHASTWLNREGWNDEMQPGRKPLTDAQNRHEAEYGWMRDLS